MSNNKDQITYYFGAGASFNAIPCVEGLSFRLIDLSIYFQKVIDAIKSVINIHPFDIDNDAKNLIETVNLNAEGFNFILMHLPSYVDELNWLIKESKNHQTIDTLAKRFSLTDDNESLLRLKKVLIIYFYFEQNIYFQSHSKKEEYEHKHELFLDKRYDNLIASIAQRVERSIQLNPNVNFISWNYDLQIEYALKNYFYKKNQTINYIKNRNNIYPFRFDIIKQLDYDISKFGTYKLNGSAYLDVKLNDEHMRNVYDLRYDQDDLKPIDFIYEFIKYAEDSFKRNVNLDYLLFSWEEKNKFQDEIVKAAAEVMKRTKILIIIGYSFPFFNSRIDKYILNECTPDEIIIEDYQANVIWERLKTLVPNFKKTIYKNKVSFKIPSGTFSIHPDIES
jgi:hypothetical protein